jgi:hypothetical protein
MWPISLRSELVSFSGQSLTARLSPRRTALNTAHTWINANAPENGYGFHLRDVTKSRLHGLRRNSEFTKQIRNPRTKIGKTHSLANSHGICTKQQWRGRSRRRAMPWRGGGGGGGGTARPLFYNSIHRNSRAGIIHSHAGPLVKSEPGVAIAAHLLRKSDDDFQVLKKYLK